MINKRLQPDMRKEQLNLKSVPADRHGLLQLKPDQQAKGSPDYDKCRNSDMWYNHPSSKNQLKIRESEGVSTAESIITYLQS